MVAKTNKPSQASVNRSRPAKLTLADWSISQLPGLSVEDQARLAACGIGTTLQLLQQGGSPEKRISLANQLQIHIQHVNKWVALADLAQIPSVGCRYCGLLLHAGIPSSKQLAQMPLYRLHRQILKLQVANLQRRDLCPTYAEVEQWSQQAQLLGTTSRS